MPTVALVANRVVRSLATRVLSHWATCILGSSRSLAQPASVRFCFRRYGAEASAAAGSDRPCQVGVPAAPVNDIAEMAAD